METYRGTEIESQPAGENLENSIGDLEIDGAEIDLAFHEQGERDEDNGLPSVDTSKCCDGDEGGNTGRERDRKTGGGVCGDGTRCGGGGDTWEIREEVVKMKPFALARGFQYIQAFLPEKGEAVAATPPPPLQLAMPTMLTVTVSARSCIVCTFRTSAA